MFIRLLLIVLCALMARIASAQYVPFPWDTTKYQRTEHAFQPGKPGAVLVRRGYDSTVLYWYSLAPARLVDSTLLPGDFGEPVWSGDGKKLLLYGRTANWTEKPQVVVLDEKHAVVQRMSLPLVPGYSNGLTYDLRQLTVDSSGTNAVAVLFNLKESGTNNTYEVESSDGPALRFQLALIDLLAGTVSAPVPVDARYVRVVGKYRGDWQVLLGLPSASNGTNYTLHIPDFQNKKLLPSIPVNFLANEWLSRIQFISGRQLEVRAGNSVRRYDPASRQWRSIFYRSLSEAADMRLFPLDDQKLAFVEAQRASENGLYDLDDVAASAVDLWGFKPEHVFTESGMLYGVELLRHGMYLKPFRRAAAGAGSAAEIKVQLPFEGAVRVPVPGTPYLIESSPDEWQVFDMDAQIVVHRERSNDRYWIRFLPLTGTGMVVRYNGSNAELFRAGAWGQPAAALPLQHAALHAGWRGAGALVELQQLIWNAELRQLTGVFTSDSTFVLAQWETGGSWDIRHAIRLDGRLPNHDTYYDRYDRSYLLSKDDVLAEFSAQMKPSDWQLDAKAITSRALQALAQWTIPSRWIDSFNIRPTRDQPIVPGKRLLTVGYRSSLSGYLLIDLVHPSKSVYLSDRKFPGPFAGLAWAPLNKRRWGVSEVDLSDAGNIIVLSGQEGIQEYDLRTGVSKWRPVPNDYSRLGSSGQFLVERQGLLLNGENWLDRSTLRPVRKPAAGMYSDSVAFDPVGRKMVLSKNSVRGGYVEIRFNDLQIFSTQVASAQLVPQRTRDSTVLVFVPELGYWAHIGEKGIRLDTGKIIVNGTPARIYRSGLNGSVNFVQVLPGGREVLIGDARQGLFECWNLASGARNFRLVVTDERNFVLQGAASYYYATSGAVPHIAFERKGRGIPAQWLDAELNRPDRVLAELADTSNADVRTLLRLFRAAVDKKVARSLRAGVAGSPELTISMDESGSTEAYRSIAWTVRKGAGKLRSMRLLANQVPVWDTVFSDGPDTRSGHILLPLVSGENQLVLLATDDSGRSSIPAFRRIMYAPRKPVPGRTFVIAIAVDRYADTTRNLRFAVKDGHDLLAAMRAADPAHTITDSLFNDAVTPASLRGLRHKLLQTGVEDRIVLSLSGHGMLDAKLDFYYATSAMDFGEPKKNGFSFAELEELLTNIPARRKLLLIDACNSGNVDQDTTTLAGADPSLKVQNTPAGTRGVFIPKPAGKTSADIFSQLFSVSSGRSGAEIIAATAGNAFAYESESWQNGVFTYAILKTLSESGDFDTDYDSCLSVRELKLAVYPLVEQLTGGRQKPLARFENAGYDWILAPVRKDEDY